MIVRCRKLFDEKLPMNTLPSPLCKGAQDKKCAHCEAGSAIGGLRCVIYNTGGKPPIVGIEPDRPCEPGLRYWCDEPMFGGWGTVTCSGDGIWPTRVMDGKTVADCQPRSDGRRPNTICACYHHYFNGECCERSDCMIPAQTDGWVCGISQGKLCDHCNPQQAECAEGICTVTNSSETFCTRSCEDGEPCPAGFECQEVRQLSGPTLQCVPDDHSCLY